MASASLSPEEASAAAASASLADWIASFVQIEDGDGGPPVPFDLWPAQEDVLDDFERERLIVLLKARQLGLTWLALAYAARKLVYRPGYRVTVLSKGGDEAKELVRRATFIQRHLPSFIVRYGRPNETTPGWESTTERVTLTHPSGHQSVLQALAASQDAGRTFTSSLVIIDEWAFQEYAQEIWSAAYPTINRPGAGQVIGISTGKRGSFFEDVWEDALAQRNSFKAIFLPWWSDPRRDDAWHEQTKRDLPRSHRAEYPATPEEAFTIGRGAAFPEWDPERVHVAFDAAWTPPEDWAIVRAYDGGFMSYAACKWYAIAPDGWAICYREYYPSQVVDRDQAREIKRLSRRPNGQSEKIAYTVADTSCWARRGESGETTAEIFAREGVGMIQATKERELGWKRLHDWLKPMDGPDGRPFARLRYTRACANTIRTYPSLEQHKNNPEDVADGEDHMADCDRYFVMSRPTPAPKVELRDLSLEGRVKQQLDELANRPRHAESYW